MPLYLLFFKIFYDCGEPQTSLDSDDLNPLLFVPLQVAWKAGEVTGHKSKRRVEHMYRFTRMQNKFSRCARALLFTFYSGLFCFTTLAVGQTTIDLDPPEVTHTAPVKVVPGKDLRIDASVTDDSGVDQVTIHYRSKQSDPFLSAEMTNVQGAEYTVLIPTSKEIKSLQYYIEVLDAGGNRVLEGTPSTPLITEATKRSNILYVVLGAVAVGALVGLAGGGGGGGGDSEVPEVPEVPNPTVLTITTTVPE